MSRRVYTRRLRGSRPVVSGEYRHPRSHQTSGARERRIPGRATRASGRSGTFPGIGSWRSWPKASEQAWSPLWGGQAVVRSGSDPARPDVRPQKLSLTRSAARSATPGPRNRPLADVVASGEAVPTGSKPANRARCSRSSHGTHQTPVPAEMAGRRRPSGRDAGETTTGGGNGSDRPSATKRTAQTSSVASGRTADKPRRHVRGAHSRAVFRRSCCLRPTCRVPACPAFLSPVGRAP